MAHRPLIPLRRRTLLAAAGAGLLAARSSASAFVDGVRALHIGGLLLAGDVVFRSGLSVQSEAVLAAEPRSRFSHVGIVAPARTGLVVVHALPAERGFAGGVVATDWAGFALAPDVRAIGAYRVAGASEVERARIAREALRLLGRPFNAGLHVRTEGAVYCTQLALAALRSIDPSITRIVRATPVAFVQDPVYLPDSLLEWPRLVEIPS